MGLVVLVLSRGAGGGWLGGRWSTFPSRAGRSRSGRSHQSFNLISHSRVIVVWWASCCWFSVVVVVVGCCGGGRWSTFPSRAGRSRNGRSGRTGSTGIVPLIRNSRSIIHDISFTGEDVSQSDYKNFHFFLSKKRADVNNFILRPTNNMLYFKIGSQTKKE